jgi:inner membrane protein
MTSNPISGLIPRGSLGLKLLLVCALVLAMGIPLIMVGALMEGREQRARQVTAEIGAQAGGQQVIGGPMLLVPYRRAIEITSTEGQVSTSIERGRYIVFAENGTADAQLAVSQRRLGIYRADSFDATTNFHAEFDPAATLEGLDPSYVFEWDNAQIAMFVGDSRTIRDAAELRFANGDTVTLEPSSDFDFGYAAAANGQTHYEPVPATRPLQTFVAPAPLNGAPEPFVVDTRIVLGGAQRFAVAAFAQDTAVTINGDATATRAQGYFQTSEGVELTGEGFNAQWRVPFVARNMPKAANLTSFNLGEIAGHDMAVSFVAADDIYQGVSRAIEYGIMFIGIVFLATLVFEAVSGKKAHAAQYILVGLAQCVFYLLLLSITEIIGFTQAFMIAAAATVLLLAYYAGASYRSAAVGFKALLGLSGLYGAMYVLMTLEDFALLAGSLVAFAVIAATMIATRRIDWYGRAAPAGSGTE